MKTMKVLCASLLAALSTQAVAVGGLADVTVFDRAQNRELPVYWHQGRAYVAGQPGNEYAVRVRNRQGSDVLAVMSVDGVNILSGETASSQQSGYVLSPGRLFEVAGWRKNLSSTAAFYFTSLPDSYAARTGRPDHVGVIGVALFRRKEQPVDLGRIAPSAPAPLSRSDSARGQAQEARRAESALSAPAEKLGTGHGRTETSHVRYVGFERATSEPAETVIIYYDSYRNLQARGVIREPIAPRYPHPHPFPGFVADPPA